MNITSDHTYQVVSIIVGGLWMLAIGIYWERNRTGGTRDLRWQRNAARKQRDTARVALAESRQQVADLCDCLAISTGHPARPRPGALRRTPPPGRGHVDDTAPRPALTLVGGEPA